MSFAAGLAEETPTKRIYRSDRQQQREANILAVARQTLVEKGYDGVTMNALAADAGVTKRTLYNIFGGKDQLLHAAVGEVIARYRGSDLTIEPGIATIIESRKTAVAEVISTPAYSDAMTRALVQAPAQHPLIQALLHDSVEFTCEHLNIAQQHGELLPTLPTQKLAQHIVSQGWGVVLLRMKGVMNNQEFDVASQEGLLLLLLSVSRGQRREALQQQLEDLVHS